MNQGSHDSATHTPFETASIAPVIKSLGHRLLWQSLPLAADQHRAAQDGHARQRVNTSLRVLTCASRSVAEVVDYRTALQKLAEAAVPCFADCCLIDLVDGNGTLQRVACCPAPSDRTETAAEIHLRFPAHGKDSRGITRVYQTGEPDWEAHVAHSSAENASTVEEAERSSPSLAVRSYICVPLQLHGRILGVLSFLQIDSGRNYDVHDVAIAEDLADRATVAIEHAQLYEAVQEADRRREEFLAMLAHELRNPLAPIRSGLDLLGITQKYDHDTVDLMREQVEHLVRLVDDLLEVSRILRGQVRLKKSITDLGEIVKCACDTVRPLVTARNQSLRVILPDTPVWLTVDPVRMAQVFGNLLDNASKFTKAGGHIEIAAEASQHEVLIRVHDDGVGMEETWLPQIFDLFTQASTSIDRSQGGLGLGLTLAKTLVEMHNGKIYADSAGLGSGSVFTVRLPLVSAVSQDSSPPMFTTLPESRRVLVVDDGVGAAKMLQMLVSRLGPHEVEVAHDGPSALDKAQQFAPDLVLLDIGLPRMDGYEVARRLRDDVTLGGATLVAVTGYGQDEDKRKSQEAGFHEHVVKPIDLETLKKLLTYPKREATVQ